jgi:hypothetical protein
VKEAGAAGNTLDVVVDQQLLIESAGGNSLPNVPLPDICKMYSSLWKTLGVSERMWSVNLQASISGEYQTLAEYSSRPLE